MGETKWSWVPIFVIRGAFFLFQKKKRKKNPYFHSALPKVELKELSFYSSNINNKTHE